MRPELARRVLLLALAGASLLVPVRAARAQLGTLYTDLVCRDPGEIPGEFHFATSFVGLVNCSRLCLDATLVCKRGVDEAAACQLAFANDWVASDSAVSCNGLTGPDLRDCRAGWASDKKVWRDSIKRSQIIARIGCANLLSTCLANCTGH
jgi:hypothetical protein